MAAAGNFYDIVFRMAADVARLRSDMEQAKRVVSTSVEDMHRQFKRVRSLLAQLGVGLGVASIVAYFKRITSEAIHAADSIGDFAQKLGVSAEFLSEYELALKTSGTNFESFVSGLRKLNQSIVEAASGSKEHVRDFAALGVAVRDSSGQLRTADAVLLDIADRFAEIGDGPEKTAMSIRLFGKMVGAELIPFLNQGSKGLAELREVSRALGLSLDKDTIAAADRVNDSFTMLGQLSKGLGNRIMRELLPTLEGLAQRMLDAATKTGAFDAVARSVAATFKLLVSSGMVVYEVFSSVGRILGATAAAISRMVETRSVSEGFKVLAEGGKDTARSVRELVSDLSKLWSDQLPKVDSRVSAVVKGLRTLNTVNQEEVATARRHAEAVDKLIDRFSEYRRVTEIELENGRKLTEMEKAYLKALHEHSTGALVLSSRELERLAIEADLAMRIEDRVRMQEELNRIQKEFAQLERDALDAGQRRNEDLSRQIEAQRRANEIIGLSKSEVSALEVARLRDAAATAEQTAAAMAQAGENARLVEQYRETAERLRELASLREEGAIKQQAHDAAEEARKKWEDTSREIESVLSGALVRGFESGKSFSRSVGDYIVNYFRTFVAQSIARSLIEAISKTEFAQTASSAFGSIISLIGQAFAGTRASGGSVEAGRMYLVGERGPELFVPRQAGNIVSNSKLAAAGGDKYEFHWHIGTIGSGVSRQELAMALEQTERATIARIQDLRNRNRME